VQARKALARIRTETDGPVLEVAEHSGLSGIALIDRIAAELARELDAKPPARAALRR
jgi:hypothetical protein